MRSTSPFVCKRQWNHPGTPISICAQFVVLTRDLLIWRTDDSEVVELKTKSTIFVSRNTLLWSFPFELERWLDEYESDADLMLAVSVVLEPGVVFGYPNRSRIGLGLHTDELEEGLKRIGQHIKDNR